MNNDPISDSLNIVPLEYYESDRKIIDLNAQSDFELARTNIKDIIEKTTPALNDLIDYAYSAQNDKAYTALSGMIKTLVDANKQLMELSKVKEETTKLELTNEDLRNKEPNQVTKVENNLYITTGELLKMIMDKKKEQNE